MHGLLVDPVSSSSEIKSQLYVGAFQQFWVYLVGTGWVQRTSFPGGGTPSTISHYTAAEQVWAVKDSVDLFASDDSGVTWTAWSNLPGTSSDPSRAIGSMHIEGFAGPTISWEDGSDSSQNGVYGYGSPPASPPAFSFFWEKQANLSTTGAPFLSTWIAGAGGTIGVGHLAYTDGGEVYWIVQGALTPVHHVIVSGTAMTDPRLGPSVSGDIRSNVFVDAVSGVNSRVFKSVDTTATDITPVPSVAGGRYIGVAGHRYDQNKIITLYIGESGVFTGIRIYVTTDGGATWAKTYEEASAGDPGYATGAGPWIGWDRDVDPFNTVYVLGMDGLLVSNDIGQTWSKVPIPGLATPLYCLTWIMHP
jgi:hypothetical protein